MKRLALTAILLSLSPAVSWAQGFADTTTGRIEESKESYGLSEDRALTERGKRILNQFKKGRESSAKNISSRYSGTLEFHDANQDGVTDHPVENPGENIEGRLTNILPPGQYLKDRAEKSRDDARESRCKKNGAYEANCFNPSGIIVDTGAAHGGDGSIHRKLKLSAEAQKIAGEIGTSYGTQAIQDIEKIMQKEYGLASDMKVAAIDELRSEAAWLEEQKTAIYDRSWKSLRAARLAEFGEAKDISGDAADVEGAAFMIDIDAVVQRGGSDREVAEKISLRNEINTGQFFIKNGSDYAIASQPDIAAAARPGGPTLFSLAEIRNPSSATTPPGTPAADPPTPQEIQRLHDLAQNAASAAIANNPSAQEEIDKIEKCMNKDVWCASESKALSLSTPQKPVAAFTAYTGDSGDVFNDTRELINIQMAEAQRVPIDKIRETVGNGNGLDFNEETDPEYFKELTKLENNTKQMQQDAEANGVTDYNTATQSVREFSGIRVGINDTFKEENTEPDPLPGAGGNVLPNRPPASVGPTYNLSPQPGSGGPSSPN